MRRILLFAVLLALFLFAASVSPVAAEEKEYEIISEVKHAAADTASAVGKAATTAYDRIRDALDKAMKLKRDRREKMQQEQQKLVEAKEEQQMKKNASGTTKEPSILKTQPIHITPKHPMETITPIIKSPHRPHHRRQGEGFGHKGENPVDHSMPFAPPMNDTNGCRGACCFGCAWQGWGCSATCRICCPEGSAAQCQNAPLSCTCGAPPSPPNATVHN